MLRGQLGQRMTRVRLGLGCLEHAIAVVADEDVGEAEEGRWKALERSPTTPGNSGSEDATGEKEQGLHCIKSSSDVVAVVETLLSNMTLCSFLWLAPSLDVWSGDRWLPVKVRAVRFHFNPFILNYNLSPNIISDPGGAETYLSWS